MREFVRDMRSFLVLWAGQTVSQLGSAMTSFALIIWAYEREGSVMSVALLSVCGFLPAVLASLCAGPIVDRARKKRVMIVADCASACVTLTVLLLLLFGRLRVGHLYLINALLGVAGAFQSPASSVAVSLLVPEKHYMRASALQSFSGSLGGILSPALATAVLAFWGLKSVLTVDLLSFAFAVTTLAFLRVPEAGEPGAAPIREADRSAAAEAGADESAELGAAPVMEADRRAAESDTDESAELGAAPVMEADRRPAAESDTDESAELGAASIREADRCPAARPSRLLASLRETWRCVSAKKGVLHIVLYLALVNLVAGVAYYSVLSPMILARTGGDELQLGLVNACIGAGSMVGALLLSWREPKMRKTTLMCVAYMLSFLTCDIPMGLGRTLGLWCVAAFLGNLPLPCGDAALNTLLRESVPVEKQGRVFSFRNAANNLTMTAGFLIGGYLADHVVESALSGASPLSRALRFAFGSGDGRAMGLIFVATGLTGIVASLLLLGDKAVRALEKRPSDPN